MELKPETLNKIAQEFRRDAALPEKDFWVVQVIKHLSELQFDNGRLVFGGGTSLIKGHKIIQRFSEDIDFRFVADSPLNRRQRSDIKHKILDFLKSLPDFSFADTPRAMNENTMIAIGLNYPKDAALSQSRGLRPFIKMEIFFTGLYYAPVKCFVGSFYNEYAGLSDETKIYCVSLEDTAIDKISSFLWRCRTGNNEPADLRHLHDLFYLKKKIKIDGEFKKYFLKTFNHDMEFRAKQSGDFPDVARQVIELLKSKKSYASEYKDYVQNMSYASDNKQPSFANALKSFEELVKFIS